MPGQSRDHLLSGLLLHDDLGHMADALRHSLAEQQLRTHLQVLWVLDKAETHDCPLSRSQLLLKHTTV